jgi:hypothetical protein
MTHGGAVPVIVENSLAGHQLPRDPGIGQSSVPLPSEMGIWEACEVSTRRNGRGSSAGMMRKRNHHIPNERMVRPPAHVLCCDLQKVAERGEVIKGLIDSSLWSD